MPFYDLKCEKCGAVFNVMAKMREKEEKLIKCPTCGSNDLSSVFTNINIVKNRTKEMPPCSGGCCGCPNAR
ncbi:FmdB family zinc ribbon protein [Petroclostridium xylanilyticum]|uniref:FmdB family zinc ribbon protein n=1 Tax=Petroclostridium xylanilyticum TaxID=1792311 RepID=UPI000B99CD22|nr:zinc ribbon domain-containing protein [Petroclostridium xylanilyticum]